MKICVSEIRVKRIRVNQGLCVFLVDETILSDEELRQVKRRAKINFALGCTLAFICGLTMTVNNFIVKEVGTDFGVIMAIRGLLQPIVMFTIIAFEGL